MRQLDEKVIKKDRKLHAVFVDLEKVYDKVCVEELHVGSLGDMVCQLMYWDSEPLTRQVRHV